MKKILFQIPNLRKKNILTPIIIINYYIFYRRKKKNRARQTYWPVNPQLWARSNSILYRKRDI